MESLPRDQTAADLDPGSRSIHDHGPIAARSWPDRGAIVASFEANLRNISPQIRE